MTGSIDIAMVGSLSKKGVLHPKSQSYGMVIIDERHHPASETIVNILHEIKAKYVYGVTATPIRGGWTGKSQLLMLGSIRHRFTAKEQGIEHLVYPRSARTVCPHRLSNKLHINDAYEIIRDNEMRNEQIMEDVKYCVDRGRTPVVLSKYTEHSRILYERVRGYADKTLQDN